MQEDDELMEEDSDDEWNEKEQGGLRGDGFDEDSD